MDNRRIKNRQIVNLSCDLTNADQISRYYSFNLRFVPDAGILRQLNYNGNVASISNAQIYLDLAFDSIIASFPLFLSSSQPSTTFICRPNFLQGSVLMQIQSLPPSGTGVGNLLVASADYGPLSLILEFISYE